MPRKLTELDFDNSYTRLPKDLFAYQAPTAVPDPYLVAFNPAAAELIGLDAEEVNEPDFPHYFSGNRLLPGSQPIAMLYAGHQFGVYVRQLGDGRAILLGEVRNQRGEKWDLHLKGGGPTPFSRGFDGRAVLRSTIREYLCSEAIHHLGIPTTRALSIIGSDLEVQREASESAAILLRLSPSHVRFGHFEVCFYRNRYDLLKELADHVIAEHFPELAKDAGCYARMLAAVVKRTARLIASWQAVGFAHGVMNTDNMSILGVTIDYGPFGFLDDFNAGFICNHSDHTGRYAFDQQPGIGFWNLQCLAQALLPLMSDEEALAALDLYEAAFNDHYGELMRAKLGLTESLTEDLPLIAELLRVLQKDRLDYTNFFRALANFQSPTETAWLPKEMVIKDDLANWLGKYQTRLKQEQSIASERKARMDRVNPKYILRNYLAQNAITRAVEARDYSEIERLMKLLCRPFDEQPEMENYAAPPPNWGKKLIVSCSS